MKLKTVLNIHKHLRKYWDFQCGKSPKYFFIKVHADRWNFTGLEAKNFFEPVASQYFPIPKFQCFLVHFSKIFLAVLVCLGLASSVASFILGENEAPHVGLMIGGFVTIVFSVLIFGIVMCMKCATKLDDKKQNPTVHDFTVKEIQKAYWPVYVLELYSFFSEKFLFFHQRTFMKRSIATLILLSELSKKYSVWKKNILISIAGNIHKTKRL